MSEAGPQAPPPASGRRLRGLNLLFLVLGLAGLVFLLAGIGWGPLWDGIARVGPWFALVLALQAASLLLDGATLRLAAGDAGNGKPFRPFARALFTGHAINTVTPFGQLGEVTKYAQLRGTLTSDEASGALLMQNLLLFASATGVITFGLPLATFVLPTKPALRSLALVAAAIFGISLAVTVWLIYRGPGPRLFALAHRLAGRWKTARATVAWLERADHLSRGATLHGPRMAAIWTLTLASRLLGTGETAVILYALVPGAAQGPLGWLALALLTQGGSQVVAWLTSFVPLQTGTAEGGAYLLLAGVGLPPETGVLLELVRKGRRLVFAGFGLTMLAA